MAFSASQLNITASFNAVSKNFTIHDITDYTGVTVSNVLGTIEVKLNGGTLFFPSTQVISTTNGISLGQSSAIWTASKVFLTGTYSFMYTAKLVAMLQSYTIVDNTTTALRIQGDYTSQINDPTATAFKYAATPITLTGIATYSSVTGLTTVPASLPTLLNGYQFNFTVDQSYTNTITQDISYVQPSVCLNWITDLCCSSMTITDVTVYPENSNTPTRSHTLSYPKGIVPAKADLTSAANPWVISSIWTGTWTEIFTSSFVTTYGIATVSDTIRGVKEHLVSSDEGLCQIYSCITNMANKYAAYLTSAPQRALEMQKYISQASAAYMAYMIGKQCGEADYEQNLTIITDIANSCGCGCDCTDCTNETPIEVVGCCGTAGTSYNTIVMLSDGSGSMTISSSPSGATETTFTIGVNTSWFSSQFNTLFGAKSINDLNDVDTTGSPVADQILYWNNTTQKWVRSKLNLSQLGDVDITGLADGYFLYYDLATTSFKFKASIASIATCTDVVITSLANKDVLSWDSGTSKWINLSNTFDNLVNVNTAGKVVDDSIKWNGTSWVKYTPVKALDDLSDVIIGGLADYDRFAYRPGTLWHNVPLPTFSASPISYAFFAGYFFSGIVTGYEPLGVALDSITSEVTIRGGVKNQATVTSGSPIQLFTVTSTFWPNTGSKIPFTCLVGVGVAVTIGIGHVDPTNGGVVIDSYISTTTGLPVVGMPLGDILFTPSIKYYKGI